MNKIAVQLTDVGEAVGLADGLNEGDLVGLADGDVVGSAVALTVGDYVACRMEGMLNMYCDCDPHTVFIKRNLFDSSASSTQKFNAGIGKAPTRSQTYQSLAYLS
jgi:hypothetical protein